MIKLELTSEEVGNILWIISHFPSDSDYLNVLYDTIYKQRSAQEG